MLDLSYIKPLNLINSTKSGAFFKKRSCKYNIYDLIDNIAYSLDLILIIIFQFYLN